MDVKSLMIGDIVEYRNVNEQTQICKVCSVSNLDGGIIYCEFEDGVYDVHQSTIHPIHITEEILKKNGFTWTVWGNNNTHATLLIQDKRAFIEWRAHSSYLAIWFDYDEHNDGVYADIVIPVKYLHELQHALRLAGLEDVADNFEI